MYLTVKTSGTQQRAVQHIRTVGGSQDDDTRIGTKSVHLGQQLVERTLTLVITARHYILAAGTPDYIDLIDKNDGRCFRFGLREQVTYTTRTHTHEHLYEV